MNLDTREPTLFLSGDITVKSIDSAAYRQFEQACTPAAIQTLDLEGVGAADSACISLLLAGLRIKNGHLTLTNLPASVSALAELYEINEWMSP